MHESFSSLFFHLFRKCSGTGCYERRFGNGSTQMEPGSTYNYSYTKETTSDGETDKQEYDMLLTVIESSDSAYHVSVTYDYAKAK